MMWNVFVIFVFLTIFSVDKISCPHMDPLRASVTRDEQRAFIKIHYLLDDTPIEIHRLLVKATRSLAMSKTQVYYTYNQFRDKERETCAELEREGRPRNATDEDMQERLRQLLYQDNNWQTYDYAQALGVSDSSVRCMLRELHARKVASRFVPHELNPVQKNLRKEISQELLENHKKDPTFLDRIIAIDESWVRSYDPKDSQSLKEWQLPDQEP